MRKGAWIIIGLILLALVLVAAGNLLGLVMGPGFDP
jgi:hypothetical protein